MTSNTKINTEITLVKLSKLNKKKTKKISVEFKNIKEDLVSTKSKKVESKETAKKDEIAKKKDIKPKETPNLKDLLKTNNISSKTKKEKKVENNDKINKLNFNEESFNKIILEYANNKNKKSEIAILKKKISFNKENHSIFQLDNELESSIFENMKPELTSFINSKFIEKIKIDKIVNLVEKPKTIYTNQDKYEYLSKKNKNLIDLKNKLGLDFEF